MRACIGIHLNSVYMFAQEDTNARSKPLPAVQPLPNSFEAQTAQLVSDLHASYPDDENLLQARGNACMYMLRCSNLQAQKRLRKNARDEEVEDETQPRAKGKAKAKAKGKAKGKGKAKSKQAKPDFKDPPEKMPEDEELVLAAKRLADEEDKALEEVRHDHHEDSAKKKTKRKAKKNPKKKANADLGKRPRKMDDGPRRELQFDTAHMDDTHDGSQIAACLQINLTAMGHGNCIAVLHSTSKRMLTSHSVRTPFGNSSKQKRRRSQRNSERLQRQKGGPAKMTMMRTRTRRGLG